MSRIFFIVSFLLLILVGCQKDYGVESFDFARDTPQWLKAKIDTMSIQQRYGGTKVYRHEWNGMFTYHIAVGISSCVYCEVYDHSGNRIQFPTENVFQDYLQHRRNEILVWQWNKVGSQ